MAKRSRTEGCKPCDQAWDSAIKDEVNSDAAESASRAIGYEQKEEGDDRKSWRSSVEENWYSSVDEKWIEGDDDALSCSEDEWWKGTASEDEEWWKNATYDDHGGSTWETGSQEQTKVLEEEPLSMVEVRNRLRREEVRKEKLSQEPRAQYN